MTNDRTALRVSLQMIILACLLVLLFGCSSYSPYNDPYIQMPDEPGYIVKPKPWPAKGWYWEPAAVNYCSVTA